jgi:uncharacterized protein YyaL (SSP411 family)
MPNRLAAEASPYLQQHAENPVDWYPWGEEAFAAARSADKPLFVSIGYATCHWCHVMDRESFEDGGIAALMNDAFVNVKVDREERPDVDGIYMTVCQMLTGHGGWPLNVILTPDRKPIFAGTYIPPSSMHGRIGMRELIPRLRQIWLEQRDRMEKSAEEITALLRQEASGDLRSQSDGAALLAEAAAMLQNQHDPLHGGFGNAPKFPMPHNIQLLFRHSTVTGDRRSLDMAVSTLQAMARGGIFDHLGFGFHRYSTDAEWLVPHFEKMLYDQALLLEAYLDAYQTTGQPEFAYVARAIAAYTLRDMSSDEGGFYSAEDADSEGVEGKFYVWSLDELERVLTGAEAEAAAARYNVVANGNFRDEVTGRQTGTNILHLARQDSMVPDPEREAIRLRLFEERTKRARPLLDRKILTDWNGLMIGALARAGRVLPDRSLSDRAEDAARFLFEQLADPSGGLLHRYLDDEAGIEANLDDYVFLAHGCYELFETTVNPVWLTRCLELTEHSVERFWDADHDGFFFAPAGANDLIVRKQEVQDGAVPSGLSISILSLARLGRLLRRDDLMERARLALQSVGQSLARFPTAHTALIGHAGHLHPGAGEVVLVGSRSDPAMDEMWAVIRSSFDPYRLAIRLYSEQHSTSLFELAPHLLEYGMVGGRAAAYVCRDFVCEAPTTDPDLLRQQLQAGASGTDGSGATP